MKCKFTFFGLWQLVFLLERSCAARVYLTPYILHQAHPIKIPEDFFALTENATELFSGNVSIIYSWIAAKKYLNNFFMS